MLDVSKITLKATPWKIIDLAALKRRSSIHLPDLQRGFVWSSDRVRALHDSLYRRYPVGALLLWKPSWEGDQVPCTTRQWDIFEPDRATGRGVRAKAESVQPGSIFVLDGQQRLTSIFRVIFQSRSRDRTTPDPDLLVALSPEKDWLENPFWLRSRSIHKKMREGFLVPAEVLFDGIRGGNESLAVQRAIGEWVTPSDELFFKALDRANAIRTSILQAEIIAYEIDADADDENVIEIFARLNQQGVRLKPGDLAAARLTGQMARFRERAKEALENPDLVGFSIPEGQEETSRGGGLIDTDILIRASVFLGSGLVRYRDMEKQGTQGNAYKSVEAHWASGIDGFRNAVSLFRNNGVPNGSWLPYRYLILPPAIAAAKGHALTREWVAWAMLASLWRHYAGEVDTKLERDTSLANKGDIKGLFEHVQSRAKRVDSPIPELEDFTENIVAEGGVWLALLVYFADVKARSFPSGKLINSAGEPLEVHHIFPRAELDAFSGRDNDFVADRLGNLTILTRSDNEHLSDTPAETYLPTLSEEYLTHHFIPSATELWPVERYVSFCRERERLMGEALRAMIKGMMPP